MKKGESTELAKEMRRKPTRSEEFLWQAVRGRRLDGVKFRRQTVIEQFIVDFFVPSHRLVIEVDGSVHDDRKEQDTQREKFLNACGLKVLRFSDKDVEERLEKVLDEIRKTLSR